MSSSTQSVTITPQQPKERTTMFTVIMDILKSNVPQDHQPSEPNTPMTIARRIERSCYNKTVISCTEDHIPRQWNVQAFVSRYSEECYRVIANMQQSLCDRLLSGEIQPNDIATMSTVDLYPEATAAERELLAKRMAVTIDKKYSTTPCKRCGMSTVMFIQVQTRAVDELSSFHFKCDSCQSSWGQ